MNGILQDTNSRKNDNLMPNELYTCNSNCDNGNRDQRVSEYKFLTVTVPFLCVSHVYYSSIHSVGSCLYGPVTRHRLTFPLTEVALPLSALSDKTVASLLLNPVGDSVSQWC